MANILSSKYFQIPVLAILVACSFYLFFYQPFHSSLLDFSIYYEAGERLALGENLYAHTYTHSAHDGRAFDLHYLYPPYLAGYFSLLSGFERTTVKLIWCLTSYLAILGSAYLLTLVFLKCSPYRLKRLAALTLITGLVVCFEPIYWGVMMGQVDAIVLFWICCYLCASAWKRSNLAAMFLAFAAVLKISPVLLCFWFLVNRDWKAFTCFLITIIALTAVFLPMFGFSSFGDFLSALSTISSGQQLDDFVFNFAISSVILTVFGITSEMAHYSVGQVVIQIVTLLLLGWHVWRAGSFGSESKSSQGLRDIRLNGMLICYMLLLSPILWFHHLCWLLVPITVLLCREVSGEDLRYRHWTVCAAFVFIATQINLLHFQVLIYAPWATKFSALVPGILIISLSHVLSNWETQKSRME